MNKVSYVYRSVWSATVMILLVDTEFQYLLNNLHLSSWKFRDDTIFQDGTNILKPLQPNIRLRGQPNNSASRKFSQIFGWYADLALGRLQQITSTLTTFQPLCGNTCPSKTNHSSSWLIKGGFPVMAEITRTLAANIRRQFFFVITIAASTRCLVQNFQLICYSQRVNATSQYNDSGSSTCS